MRIALCDDDNGINNEMAELIAEYSLVNDVGLTCEKFSSGKELLQEERFDLYFLDYMMTGMNGVQTACALREKFNSAVTLCFLTSYETAAVDVINHRVYADGFLTKPVSRDKLFAKLDQFCTLSFSNRIAIKTGSGIEIFYPRDIVYVEAMKKNTVVHTFDSDREYPGLLSEFAEKYLVEELFFRVHRSYIVNLMHVGSYNSRTLTLKNGTELPLKKKKDFEKAYDDFNYRVNLSIY